MNRSINNVLFGAFGSGATAAAGAGEQGTMREVSLDDVAVQLAYAEQSRVRARVRTGDRAGATRRARIGKRLEEKGVTVKYGIHPVAGRMPGHMNVLLAEANVPYSQLYELEQINPELTSTGRRRRHRR
jgi:NAD(P) transhydrogenase subunit beta